MPVWELEDIHTSCRNILLIFIRNLSSSVVYRALLREIVFDVFTLYCMSFWLCFFMFIIWCAPVAFNKYCIHTYIHVYIYTYIAAKCAAVSACRPTPFVTSSLTPTLTTKPVLWPQGQCLPKACHELLCATDFADSWSCLTFRANRQTDRQTHRRHWMH